MQIESQANDPIRGVGPVNCMAYGVAALAPIPIVAACTGKPRPDDAFLGGHVMAYGQFQDLFGIFSRRFDDWMWRLDDKRVLNRAYMKKFGLDVGEVIIFFEKQ